MRRTVMVLATFLWTGCAASQKPTETPASAAPVTPAPKAPVPLEEYFKIRRVGGASFSFDEKLVAYQDDKGGRIDLWVKPVGPGEAAQITHAKGILHSFAFSPRQDQLVYAADDGGNELPHLFLTDSAGQEPKDLNADYPAGARAQFVRWAEDGKTFLLLSNRRDPKYLDLVEYTLATNKSRILWESSGNFGFGLASRDHKRFIVLETLSDLDSNLYLLERGQKKNVLLTKHQGEVLYTPAAFSKDGSTLYYTSDEGGEFTALYSIDLRTKKSKAVLKSEWDVEDAGFSGSWKYFFTNTNVDGTPKVVLTDASSGKELTIPSLGGEGALVPLGFSPKDRFMAATLITDSLPPDLYLVDLKESKAERISSVLPDSLGKRQMISGELVRIPSFDGKQVPAFLYRPAEKGSHPAVISVHGGPTWQAKRSFSPFNQYLVSKGYVVLVPNVRGSTGYGKSYTKLDDLDLGGGPLQDVLACKKWLTENAQVDPQRVVVLGASYGGYMALAAAAFTPSEFAAGVDFFGISDLKSFAESVPSYWASFATAIHKKFGNPQNPEHAKYQHDRSPLYFADKVQRPLLVVQGENDARVRKDQSERIVAELKKRNVPVHYLAISGEGHGFSKNESRLQTYQLTDRFLDRYIFGDASVVVLKE